MSDEPRWFGSSHVSHKLRPTTLPVPEIELTVKRIDDNPQPSDGIRVLVDRLWPRGVDTERAALDGWLRGLAPSIALREWFSDDPARWPEFCERYRAELQFQRSAVDSLRRLATGRRVTLLHAARDPARNHAVALRDFIVSG